jgi:hypothetical protein
LETCFTSGASVGVVGLNQTVGDLDLGARGGVGQVVAGLTCRTLVDFHDIGLTEGDVLQFANAGVEVVSY